MRDIIISKLTNNGKIIPQRATKKYIIKHGLYSYIESLYDNTYSLSEKIYCIVNKLDSRKKCKLCDKPILYKHGYSTFCSRKCSNNDLDVKIKNKLNVSIALKRAYQERGESIKEKRSLSLEKHYGKKVNSPFSIPVIKDKIKQTNNIRYNVDNVFYLKEFRGDAKKKTRLSSVEFNKIKGFDISYIDDKIIVKNGCDIHKDFEISITDFYNRAHRNRFGKICPLCNPINSFSSFELDFLEMIKELNITNYTINDKSIIKPFELDFFFTDKKLAIELNGVYWHSEIYKDKNYHKNKSDLCEKQGIQLIHVWEDDFYNNKELVRSMIVSKFQKSPIRIYARNTKIKNINSKTYRDFLHINHIQGSINSSIKLGLYYKNELISVMGFGKLRSSLGSKNKQGFYELHRFCNMKNHSVVGGASKLFSFFIKNYNFTEIISYAKRDYSIGNLYKKLGFSFIKKTDPGYYWLINNVRKHRYNYRKDKIKTKLNEHMSAVEIMHKKGYIRCYDSGNLKYSFKNNSQKLS